VTLGLFDEAAAMEKFTKWSSEHDAEFAKRQETHKKATAARRPAFVKREAPRQTAEPKSSPRSETPAE
ncbi:MAG TPA: 30S ribosomal protein S16, partial [Hanamia sp.]